MAHDAVPGPGADVEQRSDDQRYQSIVGRLCRCDARCASAQGEPSRAHR